MKMFAAAVALVAGGASVASAQLITLTAVLNGAQENPAVITPASGTASVVIDVTTRVWSIDLSFSGLTTPVTVAHIHRAPAGSNGPVVIGLDGMALSGGRPTWNLIAPGITSLNTGGAITAPFLFPAAELANLQAGNLYFNIHTSRNPGGEIRGQIIPAPASAALLGLVGLAAARRRR